MISTIGNELSSSKWIAGLMRLTTYDNKDIQDYTPATLTMKDGKKITLPLFAADSYEEIIIDLEHIETYAKFIILEEKTKGEKS